ncbi:glycine/D-amino acid oxidase-like deaminating enzyme [Deinococcus metalli]|uniref:Glycine/D-amino acid oxidase-like deaminating enzyme n=1 Tax=Deinococcus metalli TaxID=1141878 RepID=A0A7W8NSQ8_9DEIO|nr:FAD-dependent oxidoreductase [Deinococcus metalli]MBB5378243.1 glycine/D-amino acid oxidase-like deaminating enzyme [Deinococcus metalli]GHF57108.1 oxidoreductase [Deinococcus metalli]
MTPPVVVIGGGIAGASVAYVLGRAGQAVTMIDAGIHAASTVPSALLNPVRGQAGRVPDRALEGLPFTWALLRELAAAGHDIPHGATGVYRPVPDAKTRAKFDRHRPDGLNAAWRRPAEVPFPLSAGWEAVLHLPEGGWVDGAAFTQALRRASGAAVIRARATDWTADRVTLDDGSVLPAAAVIHCGGAVGASWASLPGTHRAGTMLLLDRPATPAPVSFGAYLAPAARGGVLGATFEAPAAQWGPEVLPLASLGWLLGKGAALAPLAGTRITGTWRGTRLSGLSAGRDGDGVWHLRGLGSQGFLLGPLLAAELAADVVRHAPGNAPRA